MTVQADLDRDLRFRLRLSQIVNGARGSRAADRDRIEKDWREWLPAVAPGTYSAGFEWYHKAFWDWYWPLMQLRRKGEDVPESMPLNCFLPWGRGLAKSASMEGLALAEGALIGEAFGVYISSTQDKATEHIQSIRDLIEGSEIAEYYPQFSKPRIGKFGNQRGWRAEAVYTDGGFAIVAASIEKGVRGLRDGARRPTFILMDDIDERDDSLKIKQEKFDTLRFDALPMLAPNGIACFGQNLIYRGSIADDTMNRKADWFHGCKIVGQPDEKGGYGPINTYRDDVKIEKIDSVPTIVAGTPNWSRLNRSVSQRLLVTIGEEGFWRECQNNIAPPKEKLVWTGFSESLHVITWEQFETVFKTNRIPSHWHLYAGYDAGQTGPDSHPAVFTVAAVAGENAPLSGDIFLFYEYVAAAGEDEDSMAKAMIEDLALLCHGPHFTKAAKLVSGSYRPDVNESRAWELRKRAGQMIPFKIFNGSHEAASERRTFRLKWGLPVKAGKPGKTEGLSQLRHYLKPENAQHPFKPALRGKPNLYLVVANDQYQAARDRYGLQRLRWEAGNLKWDVNVLTRDVPEKFGDDGTDAVKNWLQTFAMTAAPLTDSERVEAALPEHLQAQNAPAHTAENQNWARDGYEMARDMAVEKIKKKIEGQFIDLDNFWNPSSPFEKFNGGFGGNDNE